MAVTAVHRLACAHRQSEQQDATLHDEVDGLFLVWPQLERHGRGIVRRRTSTRRGPCPLFPGVVVRLRLVRR